MSFSIRAIGSKADVIKKLKASKGYGDEHQHDAIRDMLVSVVEKAPENLAICVDCSGHHDYSGENANAQFEISLKAMNPFQ